MMKASTYGFALASMLSSMPAVDAKEHYYVEEDVQQHEHNRPRVEEDTKKCAYDTSSFRLCGTYGATAEVGWEFEQEYYDLTDATKYYRIRLDMFTRQGIDLEGEFFADRLFSNVTQIELEPFKYLISFQWTKWYASDRSCITVLYALDDLVFEISMRLQFLEASKNILYTPWTLDNWDSPEALWIDDFGLSDYSVIRLFKREIQGNDSQTVIVGTTDDTALNCIPGTTLTSLFGSGSPFDKYLGDTFDNLLMYIYANYAHTAGSNHSM